MWGTQRVDSANVGLPPDSLLTPEVSSLSGGLSVSREIVIVWDTQYEISVHQQSKSVWIASGTYLGETLQVKRPTYGAAIKGWRDAAQYSGNG
jgi:hypothetical protein